MNAHKVNPIVYVKLLNEGTEVWRPVSAVFLGNSCYKLMGTDIFDPEDEEWEFLPGSHVKTISKESEGKLILIANGFCE